MIGPPPCRTGVLGYLGSALTLLGSLQHRCGVVQDIRGHTAWCAHAVLSDSECCLATVAAKEPSSSNPLVQGMRNLLRRLSQTGQYGEGAPDSEQARSVQCAGGAQELLCAFCTLQPALCTPVQCFDDSYRQERSYSLCCCHLF